MWALALHLVFIGLLLQLSPCSSSCPLYGLIAACASKNHRWVPALPPNIRHLYLEVNSIHEINSTSLRAYDQLQWLDLGMQNVPLSIRNNAFLRQRSLTRLVLGNNRGLKIEPRAFAGLYKLQDLFLDHCDLPDSILSENFLQPLSSLKSLNLLGNKIRKLQPGLFFSRLTKLAELNLRLNPIEGLCEGDLAAFRGKRFSVLNLDYSQSNQRQSEASDWETCGNPFRGVAFETLDLNCNGFNLDTTRRFLETINGTQISHLIFSGLIGKGFSYERFPDPDGGTFEGLSHSGIKTLDLSKNRILSLKKAVFSPLKDVIIVDVSQNQVNVIMKSAFEGLQEHLCLLNLSFNLLGEIYAHTFMNLTQLRVLDLSHNHIGALGHQAFSGLPYLRALYLTGNSLKDLGFPASLPNLEFLLLGDNKLKSTYGLMDLGLSSTHVDITQNRLTNLEDVYIVLARFYRLKNFFFGGNFIKWCTLNSDLTVSDNHLEVLDLHDSSLQVIWAQGKCLDLFNPLKNLLGLNLSHNSLSSLPQGIFRGLSSVVELDLSHNDLTYLQSGVFPVGLKTLYLTNNFLASPDPSVFGSVSLLSLTGNRFHCDCHLESFLKWLNETNVTLLSPVHQLLCEFPAALHDFPLLDYSVNVETCEEDDEHKYQDLRFALFVLSALLIVTVVQSGVVYARLRGLLFITYKRIVGLVLQGADPARPTDEMDFDAFLCFTDGDYGWVESALLKRLDDQFSDENLLHCCFEARDFLPGEGHLSNIRAAIWRSRKTVCIVSRKFLQDGWCLEAFSLARTRMLEELTDVLVLLVVGKVTPYHLMKFNPIRALVQDRGFLTWPEDPQDLEWFYERLVAQILENSKVKPAEQPLPGAQPEARPEAQPEARPDALPEAQLETEDGIQLRNF
ncbi:toll-like receptor 5b [Halichoeres trimaculatus]|uniref:toll-like receptor 5b n=1 Tax=Halichoeres trimaculatus TaxID=147232 RepID=UPI003D9F371D